MQLLVLGLEFASDAGLDKALEPLLLAAAAAAMIPADSVVAIAAHRHRLLWRDDVHVLLHLPQAYAAGQLLDRSSD